MYKRQLVGLIEAPGDLVGLPDGGQTRGLGGHHVDAVAEVDGQALDAVITDTIAHVFRTHDVFVVVAVREIVPTSLQCHRLIDSPYFVLLTAVRSV